ncbi:predicted protein [Nematostella vectensis]|uniref:Ammonia transporter n=1 Tax=Nematostella vectensis TaxID=45351 RepID=A7T012_NEMVE|eukprot:XP_001622804.1 hypothetical protein NEMVEDRAFT_v1g139792 [Nematostella vectensis]
MADDTFGRGKFPCLLILFQGLLLILFVVFVDYSKDVLPDAQNTLKINTDFPVFQDIHVLLLVGFGLLMTFLKKYGFSGLGYNFLICAVVMEWATLMQGFFEMENNKIQLDIDSMIKGDLAAVTILVSFGAVLGKTSSLQLLLMSFIEVIFYTINRTICTTYLQAVDPGGAVLVHAFGAYFGLTVARVLYNKNSVAHEKEASRYTSDLFATLGTIFLWVYWPSFNSILVQGVLRHRAVVNTYYAMAASCVTVFAFSSLVTKASKLSMVHIQNATLAGGVAVGTIASMIIHPWGAILLGMVGGIISTIGYKYIQPWLIRTLHIHDTCGVNSLHGMPGILAAIASIVSSGLAGFGQYKTSLYTVFPARSPVINSTQYLELVQFVPDARAGLGRTATEQAGYQCAALVMTLAVSSMGGLITGFIVKQSFFDPMTEDRMYDDLHYWEVCFYHFSIF